MVTQLQPIVKSSPANAAGGVSLRGGASGWHGREEYARGDHAQGGESRRYKVIDWETGEITKGPRTAQKRALAYMSISDRFSETPKISYAFKEKLLHRGYIETAGGFVNYERALDSENPPIFTPQYSPIIDGRDNKKGGLYTPQANLSVKIELSGASIVSKLVVKKPQGASSGGRRGGVSSFSRKSRRRFMIATHRVTDTRTAVFCTLTYPDDSVCNGRETKRHWSILRKRVLRAFPAAGGFWRVEVENRKSGAFKGIPVNHMHLIIFGVLGQMTVAEFRIWLLNAWRQIIGTSDPNFYKAHNGKAVQRCNDLNHVQKYVSKYAAKTGDDGDGLDFGRRWGEFGKFQKAEPMYLHLTEVEFYRFRRFVEGWLKGTDKKFKGGNPKRRRAFRRRVGCSFNWVVLGLDMDIGKLIDVVIGQVL